MFKAYEVQRIKLIQFGWSDDSTNNNLSAKYQKLQKYFLGHSEVVKVIPGLNITSLQKFLLWIVFTKKTSDKLVLNNCLKLLIKE